MNALTQVGQPRAPRLPVHAAAQFCSGNTTIDAVAYDVSQSGVFLETPRRCSVGSEGELVLSCFLSREPLVVRCRVARVGGKPRNGMGLEFLYPSTSFQDVLDHYAAMLAGSRRVMLIDNDRLVLRMMRRYVERERYGFVGIDMPLSSEETVMRFAPNLIVLEIALTYTDGIQLTRRLQQQIKGTHNSLAFYTSVDRDYIPSDLADLPYISKLLPPQKIMQVFRTLLGQKPTLSN